MRTLRWAVCALLILALPGLAPGHALPPLVEWGCGEGQSITWDYASKFTLYLAPTPTANGTVFASVPSGVSTRFSVPCPTVDGVYFFYMTATDSFNTESAQSFRIRVTVGIPPAFAIGSRVAVDTLKVNVRATPAYPSGVILGTQVKDRKGTVLEAPVAADGYLWLKIDFDTGADGYVAQSYLKPVTPG